MFDRDIIKDGTYRVVLYYWPFRFEYKNDFFMDKRNVAQQDANLRVFEVCKIYPEDVARIPALKAGFDRFTLLLQAFTDVSLQVSTIAEHPAGNRQKLRSNLIDACMKSGKCVAVYARSIDDDDLLNQVLVNKSDFVHLQYYELYIYGQFFSEYCEANAEALLDFGVTEEQRSTLNSSFAAYKSHYEEPQERVNKRKQLNSELKEITKETAAMLHDIFDPLIESFDDDNPFAVDYKLARIVREPSTRHRDDSDHTNDADDSDDE